MKDFSRRSFEEIELADLDRLAQIAALWTARRIHDGTAERVGTLDERDEFGIPMQMWV